MRETDRRGGVFVCHLRLSSSASSMDFNYATAIKTGKSFCAIYVCRSFVRPEREVTKREEKAV